MFRTPSAGLSAVADRYLDVESRQPPPDQAETSGGDNHVGIDTVDPQNSGMLYNVNTNRQD